LHELTAFPYVYVVIDVFEQSQDGMTVHTETGFENVKQTKCKARLLFPEDARTDNDDEMEFLPPWTGVKKGDFVVIHENQELTDADYASIGDAGLSLAPGMVRRPSPMEVLLIRKRLGK